MCGGPRGTPGAHAPCAFAIYSENRGYQAQPRGGCCRRCNGARRSKRVGGYAACAAAAHGERAGGSGRCDGEPSRGQVAHLHETQACKNELQRDGEISSGARSGRAGSLKDEGNRARRPLRGADVVRLRAHQPMSGLKRTTEVVEHREGRGPTAAPEVSRGGKKGAPTAVPALRAVPPVKRGSCRGSVVPGSPSGDPATDDPGSP